VFSDLPSLRLFGWLSAFAMIAALIGDLLILPATVMVLRKFFRRFEHEAPAASRPAE
jgi:predicted RND superfamily exporter protein